MAFHGQFLSLWAFLLRFILLRNEEKYYIIYRYRRPSLEAVYFELYAVRNCFSAFGSDVGHVLALEEAVKSVLFHADSRAFFLLFLNLLRAAGNLGVSWEDNSFLPALLVLVQLSIDTVEDTYARGAAVFAFEHDFLDSFEVSLLYFNFGGQIRQLAGTRRRNRG